MLGLNIIRLKDFTQHLFLRESFDDFNLAQARFVTSFSTTFDSRLSDTEDDSAQVKWSRIRPLAFQLIRGEDLPRSFSLVLVSPGDKTLSLLEEANLSPAANQLPSLFLNIRYRQEQLMLTTGIHENSFIPNSELSRLWDKRVLEFLSALGLDEAISRP